MAEYKAYGFMYHLIIDNDGTLHNPKITFSVRDGCCLSHYEVKLSSLNDICIIGKGIRDDEEDDYEIYPKHEYGYNNQELVNFSIETAKTILQNIKQHNLYGIG